MPKFYNFHPPDEVRIFDVPSEGIRIWNDEMLAYDVAVEDRVLRHFSFYTYWFEVNCTLMPEGQLGIEQGPIDWTFNCDICTPCFSKGNKIYDVDLCLNVLVGPDGKEFFVEDEQEFEHAVKAGWISAYEEQGARSGLHYLLSLIKAGNFLEFLSDTLAFSDIAAGHAGKRKIMPVRDVPRLDPLSRFEHYGKREVY
jgi:hypothetical protein